MESAGRRSGRRPEDSRATRGRDFYRDERWPEEQRDKKETNQKGPEAVDIRRMPPLLVSSTAAQSFFPAVAAR